MSAFRARANSVKLFTFHLRLALSGLLAEERFEEVKCAERSTKSISPILTACRGTNAELLLRILQLYVPDGSAIVDVTFGKGAFWKNIDTTKYDLRPTDLLTGVDFRSLPYEDKSIDCFILDPPYMHTGATVHASINNRYRVKNNTSHESVIRLYTGGILEAARVLKKNGVIIVKTQDETESGKQRLSHVDIIQLLEVLGFQVVDLFVLVRNGIPMMREKYQKSARKNHSYFVVARFRG